MSVCCEFVRQRCLRRADHSSRGVLPTVVRRCVWSRNIKNVEALAPLGGGAVAPKTNKKQTNCVNSCFIQMMLLSSNSSVLFVLCTYNMNLSRANYKHPVTHSATERRLTTELQRSLLVCTTHTYIHTYILTYTQIFLLPHFLIGIAIYNLYAISRTMSEWKKSIRDTKYVWQYLTKCMRITHGVSNKMNLSL